MLAFLELACLISTVLAQVRLDSRNRVLFPEDDIKPTTDQGLARPAFIDDSIRCTTPDRKPGACINYDKCVLFMQPRPDFQILRRYLCGFSGEVPRVCCPVQTFTELRGLAQEPSTETTTTSITRPTVTSPTTVTSVTPNMRMSNRPEFLPEDCGHNNASFLRIVNGEEATPGSWPWLAALYIEERGVKSAECGAALISNNHVITAAHCVTGDGGNILSPRQLSVRLGDHNLFSSDDGADPVDIAIVSVVRHRQFNRRTFLNDIALLKLESPVQFNNFIQPICLPYDPPILTQDLVGKKAFVAGWGTTSFDGPSSDVVRQVQLPIVTQRSCNMAYRREVNITNAYLCAGLEDGGKDACQGDSGGPFMLPVNPGSRFHLIGIVSFGKQCAEPGFPGVYTNVRQYLNWITENIN